LAVQRPFYPEGAICHTYLLHPPGGVVGGDRLDISATVDGGAHALITTPGATKFYLSAGDTAQQIQTLRVEAGAVLEWLPQENIYFPGALVDTATRAELSGDGRIALWEIHCLGRPVIAERFDRGRVDTRLQIRRDGRPLLIEHLRARPQTLGYGALMADQPVNGTWLMNAADRDALPMLRDLLSTDEARYVGLTLLEDLLVARYLGPSTEQARNLFVRLWSAARPKILHRTAVPPRIWAT
jgi:urease accessory protein